MDLNRICHDDGRQVTLLLETAERTRRGVITCSQELERQLAALEQVATTDLWVMITGEPGTQKQRWAEHLHRVSRLQGDYVRFDCAATPAARFETALFGDPSRGVPALYTAAARGTLLLDELPATPVRCYPILERFLESAREKQVRVVCTCSRDPAAFVNQEPRAAGLVQMLSPVRIEVSPLRKRKEDVALLALHYLREANKRYGTKKRMGSRLLEAMLGKPWPGNERQLRSFVEQLALTRPEDLLSDPKLLEAAPRLVTAPPAPAEEAEPTLRDMVKAYERMVIHQSIRKHGSLRKAALALGVNASQLSRKLSAEKDDEE